MVRDHFRVMVGNGPSRFGVLQDMFSMMLYLTCLCQIRK